MARETYDECTPETKRAVSGHVAELHEEWGKSERHIYNILAGATTDPFAPFKGMFRRVCRVNPAGAQGYIESLESIWRALSPAPKRLTRVNYGTDVIETQVQIASMKLGIAIEQQKSDETLRWTRELQRLLQGLEAKFQMEGREDAPPLRAVAKG